jgi:hypothetical protein
MVSQKFSGLAVLLVVGLVGVAVVARVPTISAGSVTVRTALLFGMLCGLLLVPSIVSHYRSGERRSALRWGLFAIGIPVSLLAQSGLAWLGVIAVVASLAVGWEVDRRLLEAVST